MKEFYLTDLDKTFLRDDLSISEYSKNTWNTLVKSGVKISIATARSLTGVKTLLRDLEIKEPMILLDGVMIATIDGEILDLKYLQKNIADDIIEFSYKSSNIYPLIVALGESGEEEFIYPKEMNIYQKELLKKFHNNRRLIKPENSFEAMDKNLKMVYLDTKKATAKLEYALKKKFGRKIEIKRTKDPYLDCYFMTILHPKGDKAEALKHLERLEGVDKSHTTVFGDSNNDIGLFRVAGRKIAVSNAIDKVKALADIVLPWSNQEDGVMRFLDSELLKN
jgi:Cof subfamily protein (haloacid dehalogenase superfamily)